MLNFTEAELCEVTICSENFCCRWSKWDHLREVVFPDGTTQTCVGAQVRCGCNFAMSLVSYFTYEHPSAVLLTFLFLTTILFYMIVRCLVLHESCSIFFCCGSSFNSTKLPPTARGLHLSPSTGFQEFFDTNMQPIAVLTVSDPSAYSCDHPPPYSSVIEDTPPPSYKECVHS